MNSSNTRKHDDAVYVVIVDDDQKLASLWQHYLQDQGYIVDVCSNVEDAEILVHSNSYDVAIVDIFLREGDRIHSEGGVTLINRLRLKEVTNTTKQRIKVLAITGAPERSFGNFNALESVTELSDRLLHKPIPLDTLGKEVALLLKATT